MSWPTIDLQCKRAPVTGGSSGIGAAVPAPIAKAGGDVDIGRDRARLSVTAAEIAATGHLPLELIGDLVADREAARLVKQAVSTFGGLDGRVNAAGAFHLVPIL